MTTKYWICVITTFWHESEETSCHQQDGGKQHRWRPALFPLYHGICGLNQRALPASSTSPWAPQRSLPLDGTNTLKRHNCGSIYIFEFLKDLRTLDSRWPVRCVNYFHWPSKLTHHGVFTRTCWSAWLDNHCLQPWYDPEIWWTRWTDSWPHGWISSVISAACLDISSMLRDSFMWKKMHSHFPKVIFILFEVLNWCSTWKVIMEKYRTKIWVEPVLGVCGWVVA